MKQHVPKGRGSGGSARLRALALRARALAMGAILVLSQVLGLFGAAFAPSAALAAETGTYTYTFETGDSVTVHDGGSTITGDCALSGVYVPSPQGGTYGDVVLPDGQTVRGGCYEDYLGKSDHSKYGAPCDGTYGFTATRQDDGTYLVVVHSQDAADGAPCWNGTHASCAKNYPYQRFYCRWSVSLKVEVEFAKCSADAKVTDGNSEYAYAGAEYDIYRESDDSLVAHIATDASGHASYKLAPNESYYAVETKAPQGFVAVTGRVYFQTGNSAGSERLEDDPGAILLHIQKKDSATLGDAQPGATLEGAEYKVVSLSTPGWETTVSTDAKGYARVPKVPFGQVVVTETKAPAGYKLDSTPHTYTVHAGQGTSTGTYELEPTDDFKESVEAFDVEIAKTKGGEGYWDQTDGQGVPAAGVQFQIVSNTTGEVVGTLTTNENGFASTRDAATCDESSKSAERTYDAAKPWMGAGKRNAGIDGALPYDAAGYTIREVASTVPEGFDHVDDWTIPADQQANGTCKQYSVIDKTLNSRLQVVKADAESGKTVPLSGFSFQVLGKDGNAISFDDPYKADAKVDTFTTDGEGQVTLPGRLPSGSYSVREVVAQAPYLKAGETVGFTVPSDYRDASPATLVRFSDEQARGKATISKTCTDDGSALEGAEFDVVAQQDVVSPDGTVQASKGQVVDHVTTGADGKAATSELCLGAGSATYAFVETAPPAGHVLDATPHEFTLSWKDDSTSVVTAEVDAADAPTETIVDKTVLGFGDKLAGATFEAWNADDEIGAAPEEGFGTAAVRADKGSKVTLSRKLSYATLEIEAPEGYDLSLTDDAGDATGVAAGPNRIEAGHYTLSVVKDGDRVDVGDVALDAENGCAYKLSVKRHLFGVKAEFSGAGEAAETVDAAWNDEDDAFEATDLAAGTYSVNVDGKEAGSIEARPGAVSYASVADGKLANEPILLKGGAETTGATTDENGRIVLKHLTKGSYRIKETAAPAGYLVDGAVHYFTVDERGLTEGEAAHTIPVVDDYTKVRLSKRDVTNEAEVPGAKLAVRDADGNVVDSWVSGKEDHEIDALAPGKYTLEEEMTPQTYDKANTVEFEVSVTGEVQTVVMYDEPIEVSGQIDKRQEIADPTHPYVEADGDGRNTAKTTVSDDGSFDYSIDFRSTSSTWTDEFTVTDDIDAAQSGLAELTSVTTPQAWKDYDGKVNVWYRTNQTPADYVDPSGANATVSDGHENPWLSDDSTKDALGSDSRACGFAGWRLWKADLSATSATELKVSDLNLAEGEKVTAVRFEYGRVEEGFTTREDGWGRDGLKDVHDDVDDVDASKKSNGAFTDAEGEQRSYAPAVLHMQVTDDYRDGCTLENDAEVELYRNGGDKPELEDHDEDKVKQTPKEVLPQIGTTLTDASDGDHTVDEGKVKLTDKVAYKGLEVGVEHTVTGTLMDRTTGSPITDADGNQVTATTTFTPETADGDVDVTFEFDASNMGGHDVVAFEAMTISETVTGDDGSRSEQPKTVAEHKDINDNGQTVSVVKPGGGNLAQTGQDVLGIAGAAAALAAAAGGAYVHRRRKAKAQADEHAPDDPNGPDGPEGGEA